MPTRTASMAPRALAAHLQNQDFAAEGKRDIVLNMSTAEIVAKALALSPAERILLVEQISDSLEDVPEAIVLTPEQERELDARPDAYECDPSGGEAWETLKSRFASKP